MNPTMKTPDKKKTSYNRITALWLVILLGPGEWLFNPKKNKKKLIIGLLITIVSFATTMFLIISTFSDVYSIVESSPTTGKEVDHYSDFSGLRILYIMISAIGMIAVHIWALIDVFSRSKSWYENYPN